MKKTTPPQFGEVVQVQGGYAHQARPPGAAEGGDAAAGPFRDGYARMNVNRRFTSSIGITD